MLSIAPTRTFIALSLPSLRWNTNLPRFSSLWNWFIRQCFRESFLSFLHFFNNSNSNPSIYNLIRRQRRVVILINLVIINPIPSVLQLSSFHQLTIAMSEVILKITTIDHPVVVINFSKTTFFVVVVLTSVFYVGFSFSEKSLSVS